MNPTVSVIIPNYNHAPYLSERIDSVLAQEYQDFEIILLDDCSNDESNTIIEKYRQHPQVTHIIFNTENTGNTFIQWERGIKLAQGQYIWIAESDDVAEKDFLSTLIPQLEANERCVVAFSHSQMINSYGEPIQETWHKKGSSGEVIIYDGKKFNRQQMINHCVIYNASMTVFRRSVFQKIPSDYQHFRYCGDWLFWTYVCEQGEVIEVCRQLSRLRRHRNEVSIKAQKNGGKWRDTGGILTRFTKIMQLSNWQICCMRGRWTKRFRKEDFPEKQEVRTQYSQLFNGTLLDIICYEISKILRLSCSSKLYTLK